MVDASDSKSDSCKRVGVQVPSSVYFGTFSSLFALCLYTIIFLSGCSSHTNPDAGSNSITPSVLESPSGVDFVELFLIRASSTQSEFEQYKASTQGTFVECGIVSNSRAKPEHQRFAPLEPDSFSSVAKAAEVFLISYQNGKSEFPSSGLGKSMFDPGALTISIGSSAGITNVKTSVDAVSNAESGTALKLKNLVREIRQNLGDQACGSKDFYGIPAKN